ncbi:MAG: NAD(P)-dependent oxidoreductase [Aggregatilineales bacterium]
MLDNVAIAVGPGSTASDSVMGISSDVDAIIASSRIRYDGAFMDQFPTLRVISRTGIGVDNVSIPDATARGIAVCNTPDVPSAATAEHAILLMLAVLRQLNRWDNVLKNPERFDFFNQYQGLQAEGLRLGIVGLGRIGRRVAKVAQAIEMDVIGFDPYVSTEDAAKLEIQLAPSLDTLLSTADVVSLHLPISEATYHLMNAERLAMMRPGSFLINTARGSLVDEAALLTALESGHLAGAALDVFDPEPPLPDNPLLHRDDVIATPHIGGVTLASKDRLWREAITQALQVLAGERPAHLVNREILLPPKRS